MFVCVDGDRTTRLRQWAWLDIGAGRGGAGRGGAGTGPGERRLVGWSVTDEAWLVSEPIGVVATSPLGRPPGWAVTENRRQYLLERPGLLQSDEPLAAIDLLRANGSLDPALPISNVPRRPGKSTAERIFERRTA